MPTKINLVLIIAVIVISFLLISKRYQSRVHYTRLDNLQRQAESLNHEYSRLQIERGMYSSNLVLQNVAIHKLNLIQPAHQNIVRIK